MESFYLKLKKEKVDKDILNIIPFYDALSQKKKTFLINLYIKSYKYGVSVIKNSAFTDKNSIICQELKDRFYKYPEIKSSDLIFVKKIVDEDETSLEAILEENANQDDFVYAMYESNFIDKSMDVLHTTIVPKGFEDIDIYMVSQDAFADGAMNKIDYLAKTSMINWATKLLGDM